MHLQKHVINVHTCALIIIILSMHLVFLLYVRMPCDTVSASQSQSRSRIISSRYSSSSKGPPSPQYLDSVLRRPCSQLHRIIENNGQIQREDSWKESTHKRSTTVEDHTVPGHGHGWSPRLTQRRLQVAGTLSPGSVTLPWSVKGVGFSVSCLNTWIIRDRAWQVGVIADGHKCPVYTGHRALID